MHIPEAVLSPTVAATTGALGVLGFGFAMRRLRGALRDRTVVLMGIMSAFVFAAQMVNFPVFPGVSGHLLGGVLAAVLLGPWAGSAVIGTVLIVQCFLFADGGPTALGANFVNMGLIGSVVGFTIYATIRRLIGGTSGVLLGAMVAAWFTVILSAVAFSIELTANGDRGGFLTVLGWMLLVHSAIGLGEAIITGLVLQSVLLVRPDLIHDPKRLDIGRAARWGQVGVAGLAVALAVAAFLAPFASEAPDGLEYVGRQLGFLPEDAEAAAEADADAEPAVAPPRIRSRPNVQLPSGIALDLASASTAPMLLAPYAVRNIENGDYVFPEPIAFAAHVPGSRRVEAPPESRAPAFPAPMPDYTIPGLPAMRWVTALVGIVGTLTVFALGAGLAWTFARRAASARAAVAAIPAAGGVGSDAA